MTVSTGMEDETHVLCIVELIEKNINDVLIVVIVLLLLEYCLPVHNRTRYPGVRLVGVSGVGGVFSVRGQWGGWNTDHLCLHPSAPSASLGGMSAVSASVRGALMGSIKVNILTMYRYTFICQCSSCP